jgi:hypothetical protein
MRLKMVPAEPTLMELLSDPIVQMVMHADRIDPAVAERELRRVAELILRTRGGLSVRCAAGERFTPSASGRSAPRRAAPSR